MAKFYQRRGGCGGRIPEPRVLRGDGTLWLNLGDCYVTAPHGSGPTFDPKYKNRASFRRDRAVVCASAHVRVTPLKPKDLVGIPWMVAFALRVDGWYLRQDIIWHKPNPMPESVTDRCTKAHEYIFLMSKSGRYCYDSEAIKEESSEGTHERRAKYPSGKKPVAGWATGSGSPAAIDHALVKNGPRKLADDGYVKNNSSFDAAMAVMPAWRNKRSVWTTPTAPFPGAHFATFPPKLIEPCILAGCPAGGTVLDPFGGSGTTGMVAENNGRNSILIELNPKYVEMIRRRTAQAGLFCMEMGNE